MVRALLAAVATGLVAVTAAAAAQLPHEGVLVPGKSLGGVAVGDTPAQVRARWGTRYGRCRSCKQTTWYFTHEKFERQGAGVEFRRGRVAAVFTLWSPTWHTNRDLWIGEPAAAVTKTYRPLPRTNCGTYFALRMPHRRVTTVFYVVNDSLWGFGLVARGVPVCR